MFCLSCFACLMVCPVLSVLFWLSCPAFPVLPVLFCLSWSAVPCRALSCFGLAFYWLSCPCCALTNALPSLFVLAPSSWKSYSGSNVRLDLSLQFSPGSCSPAVLFKKERGAAQARREKKTAGGQLCNHPNHKTRDRESAFLLYFPNQSSTHMWTSLTRNLTS
jgi:hypothetical protein